MENLSRSWLPYDYLNSPAFSNSPYFRPSPNNSPQVGDVGQWNGHLLIYDSNAGGKNDAWSARRPGVPYGPAETKWWNNLGRANGIGIISHSNNVKR
jgi:hypothetical protein